MRLRRSAGGGLLAIAAGLCATLDASAAFGRTQFVSPAQGERLAPGAIVEVRWPSLCSAPREREIDEMELVLSLDGGQSFPVRVTPDMRPCATRLLWKVPALPTAHARLGVRIGSDERSETETIEVLSGDFQILPEPDGRVEQLRRRAAEWSTPLEPGVLTAEDLLEESMSGGHVLATALEPGIDAAVPTTRTLAGRLDRAAAPPVGSRPAPILIDISVPTVPAGAPLPLRL